MPAQAITDFAQLTFKQTQGGIIQSATAHGLGQVGRIESHLDGTLLDMLAQFHRDGSGTVSLCLVGVDFFFQESAQGIQKHALLFGKRVIHGYSCDRGR